MKKIFIISAIIYSIGVFAQQVPINDQYFTNPYFINPAKAGFDGSTKAFLYNRQQWTGIQNAPTNSLFSIDGATNNDKVGLGLILSNDVDNIFNRTSVYGTYSYKIKITDNQHISLAASAGVMNVHIAFEDVVADNTNDPLLLSTDANKTNFSANFGLNYKFKGLQVGIVAYQLAGSKFHYETQTQGKDINYQLIQHFMAVVGYEIVAIPEKLTVTPNIMLRSAIGINPQIDAGAMVKYKDFVWANVGWRQNACAYISLGGIVYNNITIGGAYEYNIGGISKFAGSTFEVIVGYTFGKGGTQASSGSAYDKSDIKQLKKIAQQQSEEMDQLKSDNKKLNQQIDKNNAEITQIKEEVNRLKNSSRLSIEDEEQIFDFKKEHEVKSFGNKTSYNYSTDSANSNFKSEQYCVIVGAYKEIKNAKLGQKILKRELELQTYIIKKPGSSFYFIATDFLDNATDIKKEHKRLKGLGIEELIIGKTWVYKAE